MISGWFSGQPVAKAVTNPRMRIGWSSGYFLCRNESGNFNLDLRTLVDEPRDVEQRRGREILPQRLAPGRTDSCARGRIFAAACEIPGQANDMLRTGPGPRQ